MKETSSMFACRQGRCRRHLRLGRAALISRGRAAGIYYFPARGTSGRLSAQLPLPIASSAASTSEQAPRALAAFDPGHGSCGGALAEVFGQSATLDLTIPQAMNRSRPIGSNRPSAAGRSFD
jgi:hypothetical protein